MRFAEILADRLKNAASTPRAQAIRDELVEFVHEESLKAGPQERLLGSSEVIESVFGKLKRLEQDQANSGFTGLVLSVAAMVSVTTADVVYQAMEGVSTKTILDWCRKKFGKSVQAKRKEAFACAQKSGTKTGSV